jgi:hypothetical protein
MEKSASQHNGGSIAMVAEMFTANLCIGMSLSWDFRRGRPSRRELAVVAHQTAQRVRRDRANRGHQAKRDRQIIMAAFLGDVGGRQIDGDPSRRQRLPQRHKTSLARDPYQRTSGRMGLDCAIWPQGLANPKSEHAWWDHESCLVEAGSPCREVRLSRSTASPAAAIDNKTNAEFAIPSGP